MIKKIVCILSFCIVVLNIVGCLTTRNAHDIKPYDISVGYIRIQPDILQVHVIVHGFISPDLVYKIALVKSAELTVLNKCEYFYIFDYTESQIFYSSTIPNHLIYSSNIIYIRIGKEITSNIKTKTKPVFIMGIKIGKEITANIKTKTEPMFIMVINIVKEPEKGQQEPFDANFIIQNFNPNLSQSIDLR